MLEVVDVTVQGRVHLEENLLFVHNLKALIKL